MAKGSHVGIRTHVFGKRVIVDLFTKHGIRRSPPANKRALAIGKCARGKSLDQRKKCFETGGTST